MTSALVNVSPSTYFTLIVLVRVQCDVGYPH